MAGAAQRAFGALASQAAGSANPFERAIRAAEDGPPGEGHAPEMAKPGHTLLVAVAMLVVGQTPFAGLLVSAVAGTATVAATYALGALAWNRRVAVAAALLLAVSAQHLVYSREALVEADSSLFATLAALVYLRGVVRPPRHPTRRFLAMGLLLSAAFLANNRLAYLPATLLATELALWRRAAGGPGGLPAAGRLAGRPRLGERLRQRALPLALGFLAPVLALQGALVALKAVARSLGVRADWPGYLEQLRAFSANNPPRPRLEQWPTFLVDATLMEGPLVVALLLAGLGLALRRRTRPDVLLASSILLPVALFTVYSTGEVRMRFFSAALPWMALAAGLALDAVGGWSSSRRLAFSAVLALLVLLALPRAVEIATPPNGYPALVQHLRAAGIQRVASTNGSVLGVLLGEDRTNARGRASFILDLADYRAVAGTYRYVALDMQAYLFPNPFTDYLDAQAPALAVPHGNRAWFLADLLEHQGSAWGGWEPLLAHWRTYADRATQLRLFDSQSVPPP